MRRRRRIGSIATLIAILAAITAPMAATATPTAGEPEPQNPNQATSGTAFAFGAPKGFFAIKFGLMVPRADSDIFAFNAEELTLELNSFNSPLFGIDMGWSINDRIDLVFGFEYSSTSPVSEMREFVDEFGAPIVQQTRLRQLPLTASVRFNIIERGRSIGSFAWVPRTVVPYVGAGAGITWWRYEQFGEFVDFTDFTIFEEFFLTEGWAPSVHAFGGVDWAMSPRFIINFEARYSWAEGQMAPAFVGFEPIDLAGFRGMGGISFRF